MSTPTLTEARTAIDRVPLHRAAVDSIVQARDALGRFIDAGGDEDVFEAVGLYRILDLMLPDLILGRDLKTNVARSKVSARRADRENRALEGDEGERQWLAVIAGTARIVDADDAPDTLAERILVERYGVAVAIWDGGNNGRWVGEPWTVLPPQPQPNGGELPLVESAVETG